MNKHLQAEIDFQKATSAALDGDALIIDVDGFEGPLDLLLALARGQKVDLMKLSVTALVEQYLEFVRQARRRRFALAADYLVMAAWLALLKSRLLLPRAERPEAEGDSAEEVAARLACRLARLDAMRRATEALQARPTLGREVFVRGDPQAVRIVSQSRFEGDLYELMEAYVGGRRRQAASHYRPAPAQAYRLDEARDRLRSLVPGLRHWTALSELAPPQGEAGPSRASFLASTLSAGLELVREGEMQARQLGHFSDLYLRARPEAA